MSSTLARRLRRIGLLPTTFKEVKYTQLVRKTGEDGAPHEVAEERTKKVPIRHSEALTTEERRIRALESLTEYKKANKLFRERRRTNQPQKKAV